MRLSYDLPSRACRLMFCVLMTVAWCGAARVAGAQAVGTDGAGAGAARAAPVPATAAPKPGEMADSLEAAAKSYAALLKDVPRDAFDVKAVVAAAGRDPAKLFAWVRENTRYVPYRGVMRGAAGVLMDRHGNSLDRALLLAALLAEAGHRARVARATLPAERAEALLRSAWEQSPPAPAAGRGEAEGAGPGVDVEQAAKKYGLDPDRLRASLAKQGLARQKLREDLVGGVTEQSRRLAALLAAGGVKAAADVGHDRARLLEAVADHAWAQYQSGGGWVDLDVLAPDAKPGTSLATAAAETVAVPRGGPAVPAAIDKSLLHEVELRVRVEQFKGGAAAEKTAFTHVLRPAELGHVPVTLHVVPVDSPPQIDPLKDVAGQFKAALANQAQWAPALSVGQAVYIEKGFDAAGDLVDSPGDVMAQGGRTARGKAGGAGGLLGGLPGGSPQAKSGPAPAPRQLGPGELTAAWVEFEVRAPGREPRVVRRDLFDVFGPAARAAGALPQPRLDAAARLARAAAVTRQVDVLAVGCMLPSRLVLRTHLEKVVKEAPAVARAVRQAEKSPAASAAAMGAVARVRPVPAELLSLASRRGEAGALVGVAGQVVVDRPNIFALHKTMPLKPDGTMASRRTIDIVANEVLARPDPDAFANRLRQGVIETHLEALAVGPRREGANAATLFAAAPAQGVAWSVTRGGDDAALAGLKLDPDSRARVAADLRAGYVVVAPAAPVTVGGAARVAWWRVDPRDGTCVGVGSDGMGSESAEATTLSEMALCISALQYGYALFQCFAGHQGIGTLGCALCHTLLVYTTEGLGSLMPEGPVANAWSVGSSVPSDDAGSWCASLAE